MVGEVIAFHDEWILVEFTDEEGLQRKFLPRAMVKHVNIKGPATFEASVLQYSLEYSDVDLTEALGEQLPPISVRELQSELRRRGLWTRADYQKHLGIVTAVITQLRGYDVSLIMNAANRTPESSVEV
jgi:hypothetical protein